MPKVHKLLTPQERQDADHAQIALGAIREIQDRLPASVAFPALRELRKVASPTPKPGEPPFAMITPAQIGEVVEAIRDLPGKDRPGTVLFAFTACLSALDWENGVVLLTRDEIARMVGASPDMAGLAMSVLDRMGIISREYEAAPGVRGRGRVIYRMNPHVAWKGGNRAEAMERTAPPKLRAITGGKTTTTRRARTSDDPPPAAA